MAMDCEAKPWTEPMGASRLPDPEVLIFAAFSGHESALDWARQRLEQTYGPITSLTLTFDFNQTDYYEKTMGPGLRKRFLVFERLVCGDCLPDVKNASNRLEEEMANTAAYPEPRPLNLDPGLLSLGKFILASTKDHAHRVYLRDGIYAEITLRFQGGRFEPWPWTYADYRRPEVLAFFQEVRGWYYRRRRGPSK